ncbi:MAG: hypothetical protein KBA53_07160 [Thermoclostridium sp.]|nr:hypothetical protein [Thermoclostridium sp.]
MIKKLMFILLVVFMLAAGAVVSMADDDPILVKNFIADKNGLSGLPAPKSSSEAMYIEEYSHQAVIDQYSDIFFSETELAGGVYLKEESINLVKDVDSSNIQDYKLTVTLLDTVKLAEGDSIVVMAFVKKEDTYTQLTIPRYLSTPWSRFYKFRLPYTGKDNPNHVRVVAFLKSQWKSLELGVNLEITDRSEIIVAETPGFNLKNSLINSWDTIRRVESILK